MKAFRILSKGFSDTGARAERAGPAQPSGALVPGSSEVRDLALPFTIELQSTFSLEDHAQVLREGMAARIARPLDRS